MDVLNEFRAALYGGDFEQAEKLASGQLRLQGESAVWLNELAQLYLAQGRFADALHTFDRAAASDPLYLEALLNGAIVLSDLGYYAEAAVRFEAALTLDLGAEEGGASPPMRAVSLGGASETPTASSLSIKRHVAARHGSVAAMYGAVEELTEAAQEYERALAVLETFPLLMGLAEVYLRRQECEKALETLERARRLEPRNPAVHVLAAQCYLGIGQIDDARTSLARAEMLQDNSATGVILRQGYSQQTTG